MMIPAAALSQPLACPEGQITLDAPSGYSDRICRVAEQAVRDLAACNLPLERPVTIRLTADLGGNCVGLYHCGEDLIEIVHPDELSKVIDQSALFSELAPLEYFDSILFHELVHAAYDAVPCPFPSCTATSEYLAYALQISALSDEAREKIELGPVPDAPVSRQKFSAIMAFWAPDRFALNAWAHLMQQPDPCAYVARIVAGDIIFDNATPLILSPPE